MRKTKLSSVALVVVILVLTLFTRCSAAEACRRHNMIYILETNQCVGEK